MKIGTSNALYAMGRAIGRATVALERGVDPLRDAVEVVKAGIERGRVEADEASQLHVEGSRAWVHARMTEAANRVMFAYRNGDMNAAETLEALRDICDDFAAFRTAR